MRVIAARLAAEYPETNRDLSAVVEPLAEAFSGGGTRRMFWILLAAVAMVLLIGTANVANLQLARAAGRGREMAIRTALGCGRGRLVRQLLTENLLLATAGGALGVAVAAAGIELLLAYGPAWIGDRYRVALDPGVLAFVAAVTLVTSVLFGLAPALRASRVQPTAGLRQAGRSVSEGQPANRLRAALVVSQTGLAVMLLIAAGLLLQSFARLGRVEVGFDRDDLLTVQFRLPENKYQTDESVIAFFDQMLERVAAVPGVEGAATALGMPFTADEGSFPLLADGVDLAGVIAFMVARRTHEFGIRLALGAGRGTILQLVLRTGGLLLAGGVALGLAGAVALSRLLSSLLYGVDALDAATFVAAPAVLAAVGLAATWLPARRAASVDPVVALRHD